MRPALANVDGQLKRQLNVPDRSGTDKVNQLRHVLFFKDLAGLKAHMEIHKKLLKPKFDAVIDTLEQNLAGTGAGSWSAPKGGYFISFDAMEGCAKRIQQLCKEAGIVMTGAGATYPYGKDPEDSNTRASPPPSRPSKS